MWHLPTRDGVGASVVSLPDGPWRLVIDFLVERFPSVARDEIAARMARGDVFDGQGTAIAPQAAYCPQQKLYYYRHIDNEPPIPFVERVVFQDELIVVADKPHFLPATPGGRFVQETLLVRLKRRLGIDTLAPMHRLDRETAGIMLFTVQPATRSAYAALFARREVKKEYQAIAGWCADHTFPMVRHSRLAADAHFMRMREVEGTPNAQTRITLLEQQGLLGRYQLQPHTGKKHQLRVHMAALGCPILHDTIYPTLIGRGEIAQDDYSRPLQLLAKEISFCDPLTGFERSFTSDRVLQLPYNP